MLPMLRQNGWSRAAVDPSYERFAGEFDRVFNRMFGTDGGVLNEAWAGVPTSIWEDGDHVYVELDLPGFAREDLEIVAHNGVMTIRGERKSKAPENINYIYNNRYFGGFERSIKLSSAVDRDGMKATLENGVLRIELAKADSAKPTKVEIQSA